MIRIGIPIPEKQATPIIPLERDSYSRKKSSPTFSRKGTSEMKKISSFIDLQSKEKASSPSSIGVEYGQVSTENDNLSEFISKLTPEEMSKLTK